MRTRIDVSEPDDGDPEEPTAWLAAGFAGADAETWRRWRFTIARARSWKAVGVADGLSAAQWMTAGVEPGTVHTWRDAQIGATEAVRWHELGFDVEQARAAKQKGLSPSDAFTQMHATHASRGPVRGPLRAARGGSFIGGAGVPPNVDPRLLHGYLQRQWLDDDAKAWMQQGIDVSDAYTWHALGLTPAEAGRLALQGRTPGDVIREWWATGIPFREVADWIGAGLTAHEAAQQRSKGITGDHAASLRALRRQEPAHQPDGPLLREMLVPQGPPGSEVAGPPPQDQAAARDGIERAFAGMLVVDEANGSIPMVDGGSNLGPCPEEAGRRHSVEASSAGGTTVTIDALTFVSDHLARVIYSVTITGPFSGSPVLRRRQGKAVLVDGEWKVARETFSMFLQTAGVECPPREDR